MNGQGWQPVTSDGEPRGDAPSSQKSSADRDPLGTLIHDAVMEELRELADGAATEEDVEVAAKALMQELPDAMRSALESSGPASADAVDRDATRVLRALRRRRLGFERRLRVPWGEALDRLELLLQSYYEFGLDYVGDGRASWATVERHKFVALSRLHARGSRVASEILALLRAGLADGAHARWRTLHEIAVLVLFLAKHDDATAERYLLHAAVRSLKSAEALQRHHVALSWEAVDAQQLGSLRQAVDTYRARFGDAFVKEYGWAAEALARKQPNFADLEHSVKLEHWRPLFGWASESVHSGARGLRPLGQGHHQGPTLLGGPTNAGLADPGQNTAIALAQIVAGIGSHQPTATRLSMVYAIKELGVRCVEAFIRGHLRVEALKQHGPSPTQSD